MTNGRDDDLPLFAWRPPACVILAFPSERRVAKVRQTALTLINASTEKQHARFRQQIFDGVLNGFLRLGFTHDEAMKERTAFIEAVEKEIKKRTYGLGSAIPDEGGAA